MGNKHVDTSFAQLWCDLKNEKKNQQLAWAVVIAKNGKLEWPPGCSLSLHQTSIGFLFMKNMSSIPHIHAKEQHGCQLSKLLSSCDPHQITFYQIYKYIYIYISLSIYIYIHIHHNLCIMHYMSYTIKNNYHIL